ncbi:hypothetical protein KP509_35G034300 [Ceratopteris richardii]|nr:hypothetical protein KP509_35G034300 [Ceratopteris richardii]
MRKNSIHNEKDTYVGLLKTYTKVKDIEKGKIVHSMICERGLETDLFLASTLISMYASCSFLTEAKEMFTELLVQDVVLWNTLITGNMQCGRSKEAIEFANRMQIEGFFFDNVTYLLVLKACGSMRDTHRIHGLHSVVASGLKGLAKDLKIGNALVDAYMKCGLFLNAIEALSSLPVQDAVSWNALIAACAQQGFAEKALHFYDQMHVEGVFPDAVSLTCSLKASARMISTCMGSRIHVEIVRKGVLDIDIVIGNALIDMYAKCGKLKQALEVFNKLKCKDTVSWTALITGYVQHGCGKEALACFEQMQSEGISPDDVTLLCCLNASSITNDVNVGCSIHAEIVRRDLMERDSIGNALINMYAKCGLLANAQEVFDNYSLRDVVSWNALIGGYAQLGHGKAALDCFNHMQLEGSCMDAVTYLCALNASGIEGAIDIGYEIHAEVARKGLLGVDAILGNALLDMYVKSGVFIKAWEVFDKLSTIDIAAWNTLISGYVEHECFEEALDCYICLQHYGVVVPDAATFVCTLKACSRIRATCKGIEIHSEICRRGFHESDLVIGNMLIDMYCSCGLLLVAQEVFDNLPQADVVTWTVLAAGYAGQGLHEEALHVFDYMQHQNVSPNIVTYVSLLSCCASLGALEGGLNIHAEIVRKGLGEHDFTAANALLDMYASCGMLTSAEEIFEWLPIRSIVSWSSLVAGYAQMGQLNHFFHTLKKMEAEGVQPNSITFVSILKACSHSGLVDEGQMYFDAMSKHLNFYPSIEHYTCFLDILSRAGQLDKAAYLLGKMPFSPNSVMWHTLLGACKKWHHADLGQEAFDHAMRLDERDFAALVCMSNICATP